jgi:hypothetical protein
MNNQFKTLLLKIVALPLKDQRWILSRLTPKQQEQFTQLQGNSLLGKARRFRKLPYPQLPPIAKPAQLPELCKELKQQAPLYIAIILEQGQFEWEQLFLQTNEQREEIKQLIKQVVCLIKPATKSYTFRQWQTSLSFVDQLESIHG